MVMQQGGGSTPGPGVPGTPFSNGGSWIYHYIHKPEPAKYGATRFSAITERLSGRLLHGAGASPT